MLIARTRIKFPRGIVVTVVVEAAEGPSRPPLRVVTTTGEPAPASATVTPLRPLRPLRKAPAPAAMVVPLRRVG
jgi:hypothetical protein